LSSLLVQQLMQENEELRKRLDAMSQTQQPPRAQQVQQVQQHQDELDTSSWESVPSRTTPTTPTNHQTKDVNKVTPGGTRLPANRKGGEGSNATAFASGTAHASGRGSANGWDLSQSMWFLSRMIVIYMAFGTAEEVKFNKYQIPKRKGSNDLRRTQGSP